MTGTQTIPLTEESLKDLSLFLSDAFPEPEHRYLFQPEVLRWKYLEPIGTETASRSLLLYEEGRIVAHVGLHLGTFAGVKGVFPFDWVAKGTKGPNGLMLLLRLHRLADIQYILGCTEAAAKVFERSGYHIATIAPQFQKVLVADAWRHIHASQPLAKKIILLTLDRFQSVVRPGRPPRVRTELRPVKRFGSEVKEIWQQGPPAIGDREPELLNHFLRFPPGTIRGWHLHDGSSRIGFALANVISHGPVRVGKVLDCCLGTADPDRWHAAYFAIIQELRALGCQQVSAYGTTPWTAAALRANGFFERGHTPLHWRDAKKKIPLDRPFHLTYLEADIGLL